MKILFLISQLPYPLDTGAKIRSFNLIKNLSDKHDITLVAFGGKSGKEIEGYCKQIIMIPRIKENACLAVVKNLFSKYPYSVDKYYSKEMEQKITELTTSNTIHPTQYDLIHCDSLQVSKNVLNINVIPKLLTEHNIESQILKRAAQAERNLLKKLYLYYQYLKLRRYEIFACKLFNRVITVSEEDKSFLAKFIDKDKISIVPNGVDIEYFKPQTTNRKPLTEGALVFTGSMDWLPNIDAMKYFCKDILPLIWKRERDLKLYIVGRNAPKDIIALVEKDERIIVTGSVEDVRPYTKKAKVFVVPLRIGGGTRLKILEAMAMGKPVVSTSIGCEGLEVMNKKNIIIADSPDKFAGQVMTLLNNKMMGEDIGRQGRQLVEEKYSWSIISTLLGEAWGQAVKARSIPILLYHDIYEGDFNKEGFDIEKIPYVLDRTVFENQMKYLRDNNYEVVGLAVNGERLAWGMKRGIVSLVFDDGLESNYTIAFPILKKYGFKATFFITARHVGKKGMMTWAQIREMVDNGMEAGSHSLTHSIPTTLSEEAFTCELAESKRIIEENLGREIYYFSSPTGFYNPKLPEFAKKVGYKAVLISRTSLNKMIDEYVLYKISIKRGYELEKFVSIIKGNDDIFYELRSKQAIRDILKKILGHKVYNFARKIALEFAK